MKNKQTGSVIVGIIIGVVLGLAAALAVAVYVTKVPVPFLNKGQNRSAEQDAAESRKNRDWDPNAPLYGKNPARALAPASAVVVAPAPSAFPSASAASSPSSAAARRAASAAASAAVAVKKKDEEAPPAVRGRPASDPIGDLAAARIGTGPGGDPFLYFVQVGAFRTAEDAEAHRAKLSLMGIEARITEREQSGRQVFRVRLGPYEKKDEADRAKERLEGSGVETALVRVQR